ncbi:MAG: YihY/virulence factor BrkB family protein, partial [Acidobacteriota bacterium]|nr:YihY/virulence factor BrkB family protein [Acidobacteriota bacterium]
MNFQLKRFFTRLYEKSMDEEITSRAAQVAFYFVFALFPLLLFVISLFGLILRSSNNLQQRLFGYLGQVMPASAFDLVTKTITDVVSNSSGGTLTFGFVIALWSASAGMDSIIVALNDVYKFTETRPWWKRKLTSVLLTLAVALLIFFALAIVIYGSGLLNLLLSSIGLPILSSLVSNIISFAFVAIALLLILSLIYTFAPNHPQTKWNWINAGSIAALVLWILFSIGFRVYL